MSYSETNSQLERKEKPRVQSTVRTVEILRAVASHSGNGIPARELADTLGLSRQVVYHIVHTLVSLNMLRKVGGGRYVLGLSVGVLVHGFRRQLTASGEIGQFTLEAAELTGETAYAVGWLDGNIVVMSTARGQLPLQTAEVPHGLVGNVHARASGKLLLAMTQDHEIERYLAGHKLAALTPNTLTTSRALLKEIDSIRKNWISVDAEEYVLGVSCVAVPIGPVPSQLVLGISAPALRLRDNLDSYVEKLRLIAHTQNF